MTSDYDKVLEFHQIFGISISDVPSNEILRDSQRISLRFKLIREEYAEFSQAFQNNDIIEMIDALADLLYVIYGTCISFGYKLNIEYQFQYKKQQYTIDYESSHFKSLCQEYIQQMGTKINVFEQVVNDRYLEQIEIILHQMIWMTYQCADSVLCIDISRAFEIVHQSNMSKLCVTENEAIETVNWYLSHEIERYTTPTYRKSPNGQYWVIYDKLTTKVLKNIHYSPPNLRELISQNYVVKKN